MARVIKSYNLKGRETQYKMIIGGSEEEKNVRGAFPTKA